MFIYDIPPCNACVRALSVLWGLYEKCFRAFCWVRLCSGNRSLSHSFFFVNYMLSIPFVHTTYCFRGAVISKSLKLVLKKRKGFKIIVS